MARTAELGFAALSIRGGLLPADFLHVVAKLEAGNQDNASYGLTRSFNVRDEIGRRFRMAADLWAEFQPRRQASGPELRRATVDGWLAPFLVDVLALHNLEPVKAALVVEGRSFPITHRAHGGLLPLVLVPPEFDLDKADAAFGEEGRRRSPFGLLQEYLNADETAVWGIVSNGLVLRIAHDNPNFTRPAWIELDLERVFADQIYADFAAFWLLAHSTRFSPREGGLAASCILERWRQSAQQTGERAREHLRDGVAAALVAFGQGFLRHPANTSLREKLTSGTLTADDLHQQLLRLVYRCLFLFVVEDRDQLHARDAPEEARRLWKQGYSIGQLRQRSLRLRLHDRHGDLWQGMQIAFMALERGAPSIGAPALGGLFARTMCPDLFAASLANADLLAAIRALSYFKPEKSKSLARINYRDLNTEELGSVYESLLELHPRIGRDPWDYGYIGLNGDTAKGSARKLSGSYYTPSALVDELIKSALDPVIRRTTTDNPYDRRAALLRLKIVDPACGSGHFLLAAARRLAREIAVIDASPDAPSEAHRQHAMRDVVQHCIYGVDRNPLALELCRTALWIETVELDRPLSFLDHHLRRGDALIGVFDLKVLEKGIPDEAYKPKTGDDKQAAKTARAQNKAERERPLLKLALGEKLAAIAGAFASVDAMAQDDPAAVEAKAAAFAEAERGLELHRLKLAADLWTAAFFAPLVLADPGQPGLVPTTLDVWKALDHPGGDQGPRPAAAAALAHEHRFFHWPLEFPEVFQNGGFDVMLGNPPWERIKLQEKEFFGARHEAIAQAPNKAAREKLINTLAAAAAGSPEQRLHQEFESAKRGAEAAASFVRGSGRYPLTSTGDINTYAVFAENFLNAVSARGRAGLITPTGIATDHTTRMFFGHIVGSNRLSSLFEFENRERMFPGVYFRVRFCLLTLGPSDGNVRLAFGLTETGQLADDRRRYSLSALDFKLLNPNTQTCPIFRTGFDAELTSKIYRRVPVLIDEACGDDGNPWGINFMVMFHMANDSGLFHTHEDLVGAGGQLEGNIWAMPDGSRFLPLYEAKMIHYYDHRYGDYSAADDREDADYREIPHPSDDQLANPKYQVLPRYWVAEADVRERLSGTVPGRPWLLGWRDITNASNERTMIASFIPRTAANHKLPLIFLHQDPSACVELCANLCSLILDFIVRQKLSGTSLTYSVLKQLPVLSIDLYPKAALDFIAPRILELAYTAWDMRPFALDLGYDGEPFPWDPARRALLRAELDAYYAYLYGLTRDELRYILDPQDVMGEDWPSETFRVLKERELKEHGEYRTRRLVLEAFDRFHGDGTFDPARFSDPHYFETIKQKLSTTEAELADTQKQKSELELLNRTLSKRVSDEHRPVLFVEGVNDIPIIEAAWEIFCPGEPRPFSILAAGGTKEMRALATGGKAMKQLLGKKQVYALSDNDGEGRGLWNDGHLHKGGNWRQQTNGVTWCLLAATAEFKTAMERAGVPPTNWPCLMENAFSAAVRRQAVAEGTYAMKEEFFNDINNSPGFLKALLALQKTAPDGDDLWFYLKAPTIEAKDAFTHWITAAERRTPEIYAAFRPVIDGLRELLAKHAAGNGGDPRQARLI